MGVQLAYRAPRRKTGHVQGGGRALGDKVHWRCCSFGPWVLIRVDGWRLPFPVKGHNGGTANGSSRTCLALVQDPSEGPRAFDGAGMYSTVVQSPPSSIPPSLLA